MTPAELKQNIISELQQPNPELAEVIADRIIEQIKMYLQTNLKTSFKPDYSKVKLTRSRDIIELVIDIEKLKPLK